MCIRDRIQRALFVVLLFYLAYPLAAYIIKPEWSEIWQLTLIPSRQWLSFDSHFLTTALALVGTTVAPWMLFFTQATLVDRGIRRQDYRLVQADLISGPIVQMFISAAILIVTAQVLFYGQGPQVLHDTSQAAAALRPLAGDLATALFAFGLLAASLFGCVALPVATAYAVSEALGWERGLNHHFKEAPAFYTTFTVMLILGALPALLPNLTLFRAIVFSQTLNGILLPVILIFIARLLANRRLMGQWQPSGAHRLIFWLMTSGIILLSLFLFFASF